MELYLRLYMYAYRARSRSYVGDEEEVRLVKGCQMQGEWDVLAFLTVVGGTSSLTWSTKTGMLQLKTLIDAYKANQHL